MTGKPVANPRTFYLDASALVKRYLAETGSAWVESLCAHDTNNAIAIARFGLVETAAAFAAKRRGQFITGNEYESALGNLLRDAGECYRLIAVGQTVMDHAIQLTRHQKLRGYDAIHLTCALAFNKPLLDHGLPPLTFVTADDNLLAAARSEGLTSENPNDHP